MKKTTRIGLTGGIGAGKSTVAGILSSVGIPVINLDEIGRQLCDSDQKILTSLARLAGDEVLIDGKLDRKTLQRKIFANPQLRSQVEDLLHPRIMKQFESEAGALSSQGSPLVVCEAALLLEGEYDTQLEALIVVLAPESVRQQRVMKRAGMTPQIFQQILQSQTSDEKRQNKATFLLRNGGSLEDLGKQTQLMLESFRKRGWVS